MKKMSALLIAFICVFTSYGQTLTEKITAINRQMEKSFQNKDVKALAAYYLDDAIISDGGRSVVTGRKAIDEYWAPFKDHGVRWKLEVDAVDGFGDYVLQKGRSYLTFKGPNGAERKSDVKFFIVWKKTGDTYKIASDIYVPL